MNIVFINVNTQHGKKPKPVIKRLLTGLKTDVKKMNKCCEKTFIDALEEMLILIDQSKIKHVDHLMPIVKKVIDLLKEKQ